jgi:hypothetical protein
MRQKSSWVTLAAWITTCAIMLIGGAMSYGESKALLNNVRKDYERQDEAIIKLQEKVQKLEVKLANKR